MTQEALEAAQPERQFEEVPKPQEVIHTTLANIFRDNNLPFPETRYSTRPGIDRLATPTRVMEIERGDFSLYADLVRACIELEMLLRSDPISEEEKFRRVYHTANLAVAIVIKDRLRRQITSS